MVFYDGSTLCLHLTQVKERRTFAMGDFEAIEVDTPLSITEQSVAQCRQDWLQT